MEKNGKQYLLLEYLEILSCYTGPYSNTEQQRNLLATVAPILYYNRKWRCMRQPATRVHVLRAWRGSDFHFPEPVTNRVPKCDVIKNEICEIMGFVKIFRKNNVQDAYSPKISNLGQIVSEILTQLCSDDSIQILLNLTWFLILWTKPNLEGFVWSRHSITGLISQRQFAPNC